jgi:hypothetical protein
VLRWQKQGLGFEVYDYETTSEFGTPSFFLGNGLENFFLSRQSLIPPL